jgi:hypothetical protein
MSLILNTQTVGNLLILSVNTNPISSGGTAAPLGSIALCADGIGTFTKIGPLDTDWVLQSTVKIPTPSISIGSLNSTYNIQNIYSHYLPNDGDFLNYNPRYYLFMAKSNLYHVKRILGVSVKVRRNSGFYHPTHQNGINFPGNTAYYGGTTAIPLDSEFAIDNVPYKKTLIDINPFQWARFKTGGAWSVPTLADFGLTIDNYKIQGKASKQTDGEYQRSALMYLAIGIDNPNTLSTYPILFGQPSNIFRLELKVQSGFCTGLRYQIQHGTVKRQII